MTLSQYGLKGTFKGPSCSESTEILYNSNDTEEVNKRILRD